MNQIIAEDAIIQLTTRVGDTLYVSAASDGVSPRFTGDAAMAKPFATMRDAFAFVSRELPRMQSDVYIVTRKTVRMETRVKLAR